MLWPLFVIIFSITCSSVCWSWSVGCVPEDLILPVLLSHHQKRILWGVILTFDLLLLLISCSRLQVHITHAADSLMQAA